MPTTSVGEFVTTWVADPTGLVLLVVAIGGYLIAILRAGRQGVRWPARRSVAYAGLAVLPLAIAGCGPLAAFRTQALWTATTRLAVLSAVVPVGVALADPVGLARAGLGPRGRARLERALHGRVARVVTFPLVASLLAIGTLMVILTTGYLAAALRSTAVDALMVSQVLITGLLFIVPLVAEDLLPGWASPGVRMLLGFIDGLLDAVPGLLVMVAPVPLVAGIPGLLDGTHLDAGFDQQLAGGLLVAVAEVVGLPVIGVLFVQWMRADAAAAREIDAILDREEQNAIDDDPGATMQ